MKQLKIDIDKKRISMQQANRIIKVKSMLGLDITNIIIQKSHNNNHHILIEIQNKVNDLELVCIQALMNSAYKREIYNLLRVHSGKFKRQEWNVLFIKKL